MSGICVEPVRAADNCEPGSSAYSSHPSAPGWTRNSHYHDDASGSITTPLALQLLRWRLRINTNGRGTFIEIISVGVALGGLMLNGHARINADLRSMQEEICELRERMVRPKGLFEDFTKRVPAQSTRTPGQVRRYA